MKKAKIIVIFVALLLILSLAYLMYNDLKNDYMEILAGDENIKIENAEFTVLGENGKEVKFSEFYGKPSVINIWATWCPYCVEEFPAFQEMYDKYKDKVNFLMVNATDGQNETVEKAKSFIKERGYTFPVYYDIYFEASRTFTATHLPTTFFIDSKGNSVTYARGKLDGEVLEKVIKLILEK